MRRPEFAAQRRTLLADVRGRVLEIGFGTGLNLPHYPHGVDRLTAVDANPGMRGRAIQRIAQSTIEVDLHVANGEHLPVSDASFDSVVTGWTLCSVRDIDRALHEIYRVLREGGRLFFAEHGLADHPRIRRWQRRLNPIQKVLGDGCHLDRNMRELIERAGFQIRRLDEFYMENAPKTHGYMYVGVAAK